MNNFSTHIKIDRFHRSYVKFNKVASNELWAYIDCGYCSVAWQDILSGNTTEGDGYNIYLDNQLEVELRFNGSGVLTNINDEDSNIQGAVFSSEKRSFLGETLPENNWVASYKSPNNPGADTEYEMKVTSVVGGSEAAVITKDITSAAFTDCGLATKSICDIGWYKRSKGDSSDALISPMRPECQFTHEHYLANGGTVLMLGRGENSKISSAGVINHAITATYRNAAGDTSSPNSPVTIQESGTISPPPVACALYTRDVVAEIPVITVVDGVTYTLYEVRFGFGSYSFSSCLGGESIAEAVFIRSA